LTKLYSIKHATKKTKGNNQKLHATVNLRKGSITTRSIIKTVLE